MKINEKRRKIFVRSSVSLILCISIILSSLNITYASAGSSTTPDDLIDATPTRIPQGSIYYGPTVTRDNLGRLYDETSRVATMFHQPYLYSDANGSYTVYNLVTVTSYDELLFIPSGSDGYSQGVYSRSERDAIVMNSYSYTGGGGMVTYWCSNVPIMVEGYSGYWYRCSDTTLYNTINNMLADSVYYCNEGFNVYGRGTVVSQNLDISAYLPRPTYLFEASYSEGNEYITCKVNFNPRVYSSFITVWGYNEFGGIIYIYGSDQYDVMIDDDQGDEPSDYIFYLDVNAILSAYVGDDLHISSISCMGWPDAHEEYLSVDWNISSEKTPGDYNPPDNNYYYTTYYNENYHYAEQNGNVVAFGNVDICLYSDSTLDRVFWDKQETLLTPYKYSYVLVPRTATTTTIGERYYRMIDELVLEFDIVINNCPTAVFDAMYGQGASVEFAALTNLQDIMTWYTTHFRYYDLIPYEYFDNLPTENYQSYDCTCFYTDSFYFKSLAYLLGDSNERLLEFESRLLGEGGAWQKLLDSMKKMYDTNFQYQTDMLTYMNKLNYLTNLILKRDYFEKYLFELETQSTLLQNIYDKLDSISEVVSDVGGEDFDNELGEPWLTFYRFFKSVFVGSLGMLDDFRNTVSVFLDRNSDAVGLDFELDNDYQQYLPLIPNSNNPTPTPIPIPTLFP